MKSLWIAGGHRPPYSCNPSQSTYSFTASVPLLKLLRIALPLFRVNISPSLTVGREVLKRAIALCGNVACSGECRESGAKAPRRSVAGGVGVTEGRFRM